MEDKASSSTAAHQDSAKSRAFAAYGIIATACVVLVLCAATVHTHFKRRRAHVKPRAILLPLQDPNWGHIYSDNRLLIDDPRLVAAPVRAHARSPRNIGLPSHDIDGDAPDFDSIRRRDFARDPQRYDPTLQRQVLEARESVDTLPRYDDPPAYNSAGKSL
ncbi:Nn.00g032220.m01.CDS01 [Neocucurbitaria sp. VM-36]